MRNLKWTTGDGGSDPSVVPLKNDEDRSERKVYERCGFSESSRERKLLKAFGKRRTQLIEHIEFIRTKMKGKITKKYRAKALVTTLFKNER